MDNYTAPSIGSASKLSDSPQHEDEKWLAAGQSERGQIFPRHQAEWCEVTKASFIHSILWKSRSCSTAPPPLAVAHNGNNSGHLMPTIYMSYTVLIYSDIFIILSHLILITTLQKRYSLTQQVFTYWMLSRCARNCVTGVSDIMTNLQTVEWNLQIPHSTEKENETGN